jgi:hypothetical protein
MCTTISQLWRKDRDEAKKTKGTKFYTFKEFVTLHNQGKLDANYYNGQTICPKNTVSIQYLPLGLIVIGAALVGYAIAKK